MSDGQRSLLPAPSRRFTLARINDITIKADPTWLLWLVLLVYIAHQRYPGVGGRYWVISGVLAVALSACVVAHELAHSLVAKAFGIPVRTITLFMLGGVSQMEKEAPDARTEYYVALAGPLMSLLLAAIFACIARVLEPSTRWPGAFGFLAYMNLVLALFNLIPAFPMDGGRILRCMLWRKNGSRSRATRVAGLIGRSFGGILIALGAIAFATSIIQKQRDIGFLWLSMIGLFVYNAATASGAVEGAERPNQPPPVV